MRMDKHNEANSYLTVLQTCLKIILYGIELCRTVEEITRIRVSYYII